MKAAIIGAGAAGLAAAYDLAGAGHQVTVYEAGANAGGLASGFKEPHWDWTLERFYHHWFQSDHDVLRLIDEIGARDKVLFPRPTTVIYYRGRFYPFDSMFGNMPQFVLTHFAPWDAVRFGLAGAYLKFSSNWRALEKVSADAWMRKWMGRHVYETLWKPLLVGKFADEYDKVNMAWMWARIHARTTRLGTFVGGFQAFFDTLAAAVRERGVCIQFNSPVREIAPTPERAAGLSLQTPQGPVDVDACIVTTSPKLLARLTPALPGSYLAQLNTLKSMGAVVVILALDRQLSEQGYYWHNLPKEAGFPFLALCEHTNFVSPEHFGGDHLVYCGDYLKADHEYFGLSQDELLERFVPALPRFNAGFERSWIKRAWVFKEAYAQPVPPVNHSRNIPDIRTPIKGLYFASMSQVYPWDRGTNYAVRIGRESARLLAEDAAPTGA
jgi:protoporphyrinogen oxidase